RILTDQKEKKSGRGRIIGTPIYMSPEARENPQSTTFQSDIYSLGIIAYELAIGKITHGKLILSLAPRGMQKILNKALQPSLDERYQDIVDFISDISNYMNSSEVEKDRQGSDYFFELYERMEKFQNGLLPPQAPSWNGIEIGLSHIFGMGLNGLYYEFFDVSPTQKAIFVAEASMKGAEGVLFTSMLRSVIRTLIKTKNFHPADFFTLIQERIQEDIGGETFHLSFLVLDTATKSYDYYSTGYGILLQHSSSQQTTETIASSHAEKRSFREHDRLLLIGHIGQEKHFEEACRQTLELPPQKQVEGILRKMRVRSNALCDEHPLLIVSLSFI
ncbi:MAG: pkn, partial [Chlamydiia bacterium]|nr:pkn [Chlamydiia bacterium]